MTRREYRQSCSIAGALDRIGERWSLLVVRELLLGPLRFSDLARSMGGPPTDVLTKRLRDLEHDGIVRRRELDPPATGVAYELTDLGRELDSLLLELGRWGLNFYAAEDVADLEASWLPNSFRVLLQPPTDAVMTVQLRSEGRAFGIRVAGGRISAERGEIYNPDLVVSGSPRGIVAALVVGGEHVERVEMEGDTALFEALREMVVLPARLREDARTVSARTA